LKQSNNSEEAQIFFLQKKGGLDCFWFVIGEGQLSSEKDDKWSSPGTLFMLPTRNIRLVVFLRLGLHIIPTQRYNIILTIFPQNDTMNVSWSRNVLPIAMLYKLGSNCVVKVGVWYFPSKKWFHFNYFLSSWKLICVKYFRILWKVAQWMKHYTMVGNLKSWKLYNEWKIED
jgi:hypothetical protein